MDPVILPSDPQSHTGYSYARNNPVNFTDPTGKDPLMEQVGPGSAAGTSALMGMSSFQAPGVARYTHTWQDSGGSSHIFNEYDYTGSGPRFGAGSWEMAANDGYGEITFGGTRTQHPQGFIGPIGPNDFRQALGDSTPWIQSARDLAARNPELADHLAIAEALDDVFGTPIGGRAYDTLLESGRTLTIEMRGGIPQAKRGGYWIGINPHNLPFIDVEGSILAVRSPLAQALGHELGHAVLGYGDWGPGKMFNITTVENPIANALGYPSRTSYSVYGDEFRAPYF